MSLDSCRLVTIEGAIYDLKRNSFPIHHITTVRLLHTYPNGFILAVYTKAVGYFYNVTM
jgi:hypothetical protein